TLSSERFDGLFICTKRAIVADVDILTAKPELVISSRPTYVFVELEEVLRTAKRYRVAWSERRVSGQVHKVTEDPCGGLWEEVERGTHSLISKRLNVVQAVEHYLRLRHQMLREGVSD